MTEFDISQASEEIAEMKAALATRQAELREAGLAQIRQIMDTLDFSVEDLQPSANPRHKCEPKYRGPNGELWSGRGRKPSWLASLLDEGHSLEEFKI